MQSHAMTMTLKPQGSNRTVGLLACGRSVSGHVRSTPHRCARTADCMRRVEAKFLIQADFFSVRPDSET